MAPDANSLLTDLLKAVSRSFYITLRMLPSSVRPQIGLAYLLARATDTVADTDAIPVNERLNVLAALRERIDGSHSEVDLSAIINRDNTATTSHAEKTLLRRIEEAISVLESFAPEDQRSIRGVIATITSGQAFDLQRFGSATRESIRALETDADLDDYTYRVAGCVGEFWTTICLRHAIPSPTADRVTLFNNAVRFGKGLQLVNILRDLPRDLQQGRCYIPAQRLAQAGLHPADLLSNAAGPKFLPLYHELLEKARGHLNAGWDYTNALPRSAVRIRLGCAVPLLIGVETISRLRDGQILDPSQRIKVSRADVKRIVRSAIIRYPLPSLWRRLFTDCEQRVQKPQEPSSAVSA